MKNHNKDNTDSNSAELANKVFNKPVGTWIENIPIHDFTLSRERMPEFDGMYYVYGFMHHPCGNITPFHKIVECRMNQWVKSDIGEQMTYWTYLLQPPVITDEEYSFQN